MAGTAEPAYLGVDRSLSGKRWQLRAADDRLALALAQRHGLPELLGRVLAARGVGLEQAAGFLEPTLRDALPDPSSLRGMDIGAERLATAVMQGETIALFGDYDVDGATSIAVLGRFLRAVGGRTVIYVPDRLSEGYGPNGPAMRRLRERGASLVVTLDCGISAFEALDDAADAGLEVIVVDHHEADARLPRAAAVINPNRLDEDGRFGYLAAVGVAFLVAVAVNRALRDAGWYAGNRRQPDLLALLDLVALGTVCDVVPLVGVNRAIVAQGLKVMARRANPGLAALADVAGVREPPGTYHAGFVLGPRVNAGGRVGRSDLGATLLSTNDPAEAREFARLLDGFNAERQEIEARILAEAQEAVERDAEAAPGGALIMVGAEGWHPGVVGIVASRLVERYNRPACVVAFDEAKGVGSGRSVAGLDLGAAVIAARQAGLLIKGGGHAMAAGFTVARAAFADLRRFLAERLNADVPAGGLVARLQLDGALSVTAANRNTLSVVGRAAPFGAGNAEPRFVLPDVLIGKADVVGERHVRCFLDGAQGGGGLKAIAFRSLDSDLGQALLRHRGAAFHIAGRLREDTWRGNGAVQLLIDDAARAGGI